MSELEAQDKYEHRKRAREEEEGETAASEDQDQQGKRQIKRPKKAVASASAAIKIIKTVKQKKLEKKKLKDTQRLEEYKKRIEQQVKKLGSDEESEEGGEKAKAKARDSKRKEQKERKERKKPSPGLTAEEQKQWFGKIFVNTKSYSSPDVVQIVGFTKARVRVRDVKLNITHHRLPPGGGSASIKKAWLRANPLDKPRNGKGRQDTCFDTAMFLRPEADDDDGSYGLQIKGEFYLHYDIDMSNDEDEGGFTWCEY